MCKHQALKIIRASFKPIYRYPLSSKKAAIRTREFKLVQLDHAYELFENIINL